MASSLYGTQTHTLSRPSVSDSHSLSHTYQEHTLFLSLSDFEEKTVERVILCTMNYANDTKCQIILRISGNLKSV